MFSTGRAVEIQVEPLQTLDPQSIYTDMVLDLILGNPETLNWDMVDAMFGPLRTGALIYHTHRETNWPKLLSWIDPTKTANSVARALKSEYKPFYIGAGWQTIDLEEPEGAIVNIWKPFV
jgi:hypothetical protein